MPIAFDHMNAKTSHYQNNGPLNALVHVLVSKKADGQSVIQPDPALQRELSKAFYDEWGTYLSLQQLVRIVEHTTDPMHREMLLGPVLRRMLPEEETGQGDSGSAEVSVEAVAKLGKRFGIRVESYKTPEGIKAEIKEAILKSRPPLADPQREETLQRLVDREFESITNNINDPRNTGADGLKDFLAETDDTLEEDAPDHHATLRLLRKDKGYRFQAINHDDNANLIITADHNSSQGYKTPCDYAQAAPVLREQLRAAVMTEVAAAGNNAARQAAAIGTALQNNTSRLFSEYQTSSAKASQTGGATKGGFDGMMDGLLGNVSTFFSGDVFGSMKGIAGLIESIFGPLMKMLMGFQETMFESAKRPGDPLSKKEMDEYSKKSEALGTAATDFSMRVEALGESTSAKVLNAAWRKDPDSIGVWASLIDKLVAEGELAAANDCLSDQERRLLEKLTAIAASSEDDKKQEIETTIRIYQEAINPLARAMSHPTVGDALKHESLQSRLGLFKELHMKAGELSSKHARFTEATMKQEKLTVDETLVTLERTAAEAMNADTLVARFTAAQTTLTNLLRESAEIIENNSDFTTQFSLGAEPAQGLFGNIWGGPQRPTSNIGQCAAVAAKIQAARL